MLAIPSSHQLFPPIFTPYVRGNIGQMMRICTKTKHKKKRSTADLAVGPKRKQGEKKICRLRLSGRRLPRSRMLLYNHSKNAHSRLCLHWTVASPYGCQIRPQPQLVHMAPPTICLSTCTLVVLCLVQGRHRHQNHLTFRLGSTDGLDRLRVAQCLLQCE